MRKILSAILLGSLVTLAAFAAAPAKLKCDKTGKTIEKCCCVEKDKKLICTLTGEKLDSCCCKPAKKSSART